MPANNHAKGTQPGPVEHNDTATSQADVQAQNDARAKEQAAAQDDSQTIAREKDTSRTAALRK